jgi:hypothetical protein
LLLPRRGALLLGGHHLRADRAGRPARRLVCPRRAGEFPHHLRGEFDPDATLPNLATFTGWSRGRHQLWLSSDKDAAYLVDIDNPRAIERWPASKEPNLCA